MKDCYEALGAHFITNTLDPDESCVFCKIKIKKDTWRVRKGGFCMCFDCAGDLGDGMKSAISHGRSELSKDWDFIKLKVDPEYPNFCTGCDSTCFGGESYWVLDKQGFVLCVSCVRSLHKELE